MEGNWVLKVYLDKYKLKKVHRFCRRWEMTLKDNCYVRSYEKKPKRLIRKLQIRGIRYICYPKQYERSSNYRKNFFAANHEPYRCRYCHKPLTKSQLCVDHIIPVAQAQKSRKAKFMLAFKGYDGVNDVRNLAPSCSKCNTRKSDKMGLWVVRGWLGKYRLYWLLLRMVQIALVCLAGYGILWLLKYLELTM